MPILAAQAPQHPRPRLPIGALVMRQRHVAHHRAIGVRPARHPQVHAHQHARARQAAFNQALAGEPYEAMPIRAFLARPLEIYWCP